MAKKQEIISNNMINILLNTYGSKEEASLAAINILMKNGLSFLDAEYEVYKSFNLTKDEYRLVLDCFLEDYIPDNIDYSLIKVKKGAVN